MTNAKDWLTFGNPINIEKSMTLNQNFPELPPNSNKTKTFLAKYSITVVDIRKEIEATSHIHRVLLNKEDWDELVTPIQFRENAILKNSVDIAKVMNELNLSTKDVYIDIKIISTYQLNDE